MGAEGGGSMESSPVIQRLQQQLNLGTEVLVQSNNYLRRAVAAKLDAKYNETILACAALYIYCRRNGVHITMAQMCGVVPITREELMNAYEDVRKVV